MQEKANPEDWDQVKVSHKTAKQAIEVSSKYLEARASFLTETGESKLLRGNDNFIGRIAEMLAILHFHHSGVQKIERPKSKSHKGVDLILTGKDGRKRLISVKCVTHENKSGRSSRIRWAGDDTQPPQSPPDNFEVWLVLIKDNKYCIHNVSARCKQNNRLLKYTHRSHVPGHPNPYIIPFSEVLRQPRP